jgi:7-carboxy-7-deazaguanine synthase
MLAINEEFYSIQGEGLHTGVPMYFVRLQGCDVGCYFCDTKYTWRDTKPDVEEKDIIQRASKKGADWMCITGGEPYEQDLSELLRQAEHAGIKTTIETSGSVWKDYHPNPDWITLSPKDLFTKKNLVTKDEFKSKCNEIKVVITKQSDIDYYIQEYYQYCDEAKPLIFQPVDNDTSLVDMIMTTIQKEKLLYARCMIQCHKVINLR